jgi:16S rRNA (guanine(1405)-N(7))-methyltransferase
LKTAVKQTKNKLHQIAGAYFLRKPNYDLWLEKLMDAEKSGDEGSFRRICVEIMSYHYSTKQRLGILDQFYTEAFSFLPPVRTVMDIGCGLHPLAIPWMPLHGGIEYYAYDIYEDLTRFLNGFLAILSVRGCAETRDILQDMPKIRTDLALILNMLPCLEQVEKSSTQRILEPVNAKSLMISFPTQTLCGRKKKMREHYATYFSRLLGEKDWVVQRLDFEKELVFLVTKPKLK